YLVALNAQDAFQEALTGTRYPLEDRTHVPVPDTGRGISPRSRCRLQPSRRARARGSRRARLVPGAAPGRIKVLAGDEAGEARWHASALKGVHHVSILVDDGSCDGAGENSANVRDGGCSVSLRGRGPADRGFKGANCPSPLRLGHADRVSS